MKKVKLILDTDIGGDCDDAGAMAVMHRLEKLGRCEILAVTSCTSKISGAACIDIINRYYGRNDIPIGILQESGFNLEHDTYASVLFNEFDSRFKDGGRPECAINVMRRALVHNEGVVICAIGSQKNLKALLTSQPDELSVKTGEQLIREKVDALYIMGGHFEETSFPVYFGDERMSVEWNILQDVEAASYVAENWPGKIAYVPYEIGAVVKTGESLMKQIRTDNPVKRAYEVHAGGIRESWDPITLLCAVDRRKTEEFIEFEDKCRISFDTDGRSTCKKDGGTNHCYARKVTDAERITRIINKLMV